MPLSVELPRSTWERQYQAFEDRDLVELLPGRSEEEIETVIRAVYRQVLGNAYVMESERLIVPESQIKRGEINVREFVRQVAKSELYKSRFFDNCPRYRAIELNFKHLLGRAPESYEEMKYHSSLLDNGGYETEIDSYLDSDEYQDAFGENIVPFYRGYKTQTGKRMVGFTHMLQMLPSASSSDKDMENRSRLNRLVITDNPSGERRATDINKLLAAILTPKIRPSVTPLPEEVATSEAYQALQRKCQEQAELLEKLQQQLAELQPFATIGALQLSKWQSYSTLPNGGSDLTTSMQAQGQITATVEEPESYEALQKQSEKQAEEIAALREKIADLRRLSPIGEARLNKWRSRTFSR
ncbi:MAG: phycobilisome rod-core linker polypeptide [Xenococcaceae cyanobacterium]